MKVKWLKVVLMIMYATVGGATPLLPMAHGGASWSDLAAPAAVLASMIGAANAVIAFFDPTHRPVRTADSSGGGGSNG